MDRNKLVSAASLLKNQTHKTRGEKNPTLQSSICIQRVVLLSAAKGRRQKREGRRPAPEPGQGNGDAAGEQQPAQEHPPPPPRGAAGKGRSWHDPHGQVRLQQEGGQLLTLLYISYFKGVLFYCLILSSLT